MDDIQKIENNQGQIAQNVNGNQIYIDKYFYNQNKKSFSENVIEISINYKSSNLQNEQVILKKILLAIGMNLKIDFTLNVDGLDFIPDNIEHFKQDTIKDFVIIGNNLKNVIKKHKTQYKNFGRLDEKSLLKDIQVNCDIYLNAYGKNEELKHELVNTIHKYICSIDGIKNNNLIRLLTILEEHAFDLDYVALRENNNITSFLYSLITKTEQENDTTTITMLKDTLYRYLDQDLNIFWRFILDTQEMERISLQVFKKFIIQNQLKTNIHKDIIGKHPYSLTNICELKIRETNLKYGLDYEMLNYIREGWDRYLLEW